MKRTFLSRRNALLSPGSFSAGTVAVGIAVFLLAVRLLLPNVFWTVLSPLYHAADAIGAGSHSFFAGFEDASVLALRNEELEKQNAALVDENRALADKAGALDALSPGGIAAGVVSRPPESPYDSLIVKVGSKEGVVPGMEAFGPGGVPVGVVTDVLPDFSRVLLFSSPSMTFDAWLGGKHTPIRITGGGGGSFRASLPRLAGVAQGDQVYVAAGGALPIGSVVRIDTDPSSPVVTLQIQGAVNPFTLTWLSLRDTGSAFMGALSWKNAESL